MLPCHSKEPDIAPVQEKWRLDKSSSLFSYFKAFSCIESRRCLAMWLCTVSGLCSRSAFVVTHISIIRRLFSSLLVGLDCCLCVVDMCGQCHQT